MPNLPQVEGVSRRFMEKALAIGGDWGKGGLLSQISERAPFHKNGPAANFEQHLCSLGWPKRPNPKFCPLLRCATPLLHSTRFGEIDAASSSQGLRRGTEGIRWMR